MHPVRKQRLYIVIFIVAGASIAAALAFWALQDNMNFFYAPTQIERGEAPLGKTIRVGGLVVPGSLKRSDSFPTCSPKARASWRWANCWRATGSGRHRCWPSTTRTTCHLKFTMH